MKYLTTTRDTTYGDVESYFGRRTGKAARQKQATPYSRPARRPGTGVGTPYGHQAANNVLNAIKLGRVKPYNVVGKWTETKAARDWALRTTPQHLQYQLIASDYAKRFARHYGSRDLRLLHARWQEAFSRWAIESKRLANRFVTGSETAEQTRRAKYNERTLYWQMRRAGYAFYQLLRAEDTRELRGAIRDWKQAPYLDARETRRVAALPKHKRFNPAPGASEQTDFTMVNRGLRDTAYPQRALRTTYEQMDHEDTIDNEVLDDALATMELQLAQSDLPVPLSDADMEEIGAVIVANRIDRGVDPEHPSIPDDVPRQLKPKPYDRKRAMQALLDQAKAKEERLRKQKATRWDTVHVADRVRRPPSAQVAAKVNRATNRGDFIRKKAIQLTRRATRSRFVDDMAEQSGDDDEPTPYDELSLEDGNEGLLDRLNDPQGDPDAYESDFINDDESNDEAPDEPDEQHMITMGLEHRLPSPVQRKRERDWARRAIIDKRLRRDDEGNRIQIYRTEDDEDADDE